MAYEAMNNAGAMNTRLIVVLNDNDMSIAPPVGAMSAYLTRLMSSRQFRSPARTGAPHPAASCRAPVSERAERAESFARGIVTGGTLFEELGFYYVGPIDGHNLDHILPVLKNVRDSDVPGPVLIHCITAEGQGLRARREVRRQVSRREQVRRRHRRPGEGAGEGAELHQGVLRHADQAGGEGREASSPSMRPCRRAPASTSSPRSSPSAASMSASPSSMR